ncbi:COMM domain-containing protein 10-like [Lineus longissimus]|uniref:COMM domain-containing protein 10-like n=1 Tax=Lineus longissimus TaxID=88925 RepID=UPI002B4ED5E8
MALMFTVTSSIKKAVTLINSLDDAKFPRIISRILQKFHLKDEHAFSEEEEEKLQLAFGLGSQELGLVIETLEFFLHQAAYHTAKPAVLSQQLKELELSESKIQAIVEAWSTNAKGIIEKLRQRTVAPKQLEDINWRLNLQMAQASKSRLKLPNAQFELGVRDDRSGEKEKIRMEFSHDELYAFYNQLETIQTQIDNLS